MMYLLDDYFEGDIVDVYPMTDDDFYDFTGTIVGFKNGLITVKDSDDDIYHVEARQCRLSESDDAVEDELDKIIRTENEYI